MSHKPGGLKLSAQEIQQTFSDPVWAQRFPPVLDVPKAAELAGVSPATIYDWSSRGLLKGCSRRVGRRLRIYRDRFLVFLFS